MWLLTGSWCVLRTVLMHVRLLPSIHPCNKMALLVTGLASLIRNTLTVWLSNTGVAPGHYQDNSGQCVHCDTRKRWELTSHHQLQPASQHFTQTKYTHHWLNYSIKGSQIFQLNVGPLGSYQPPPTPTQHIAFLWHWPAGVIWRMQPGLRREWGANRFK